MEGRNGKCTVLNARGKEDPGRNDSRHPRSLIDEYTATIINDFEAVLKQSKFLDHSPLNPAMTSYKDFLTLWNIHHLRVKNEVVGP